MEERDKQRRQRCVPQCLLQDFKRDSAAQLLKRTTSRWERNGKTASSSRHQRHAQADLWAAVGRHTGLIWIPV